MTASLHLASDLSLPIDAVTQRFAFLGRVGSGKTYGATKLAELMDEVGAQFVWFDPVGVGYGLRVPGTGPALRIFVFGGLHGDLPISPTAGALLADLIVDRGISAVLDVSQFEVDADKARFARDFAARFFFRKKAAPSAVHLFIDEAQEFVPENPAPNETLMLHAFTRMAKLGRNFGIGISLLSQRPQEISKKVLNLTECLFAFQMTGKHERDSVQAWATSRGVDDKKLKDVLPFLKVGEPHVWSPAWLDVDRAVRISEKRTANVSATPLVGAKRDVRELTPIDVEGLRAALEETVAAATDDDPKELRRRIAELEKKLAAKPPPAPAMSDEAFAALASLDVATLGALQAATTARERYLELAQLGGGATLSPPRHQPSPAPVLPESIQPRPAETLAQKKSRVAAGDDGKRPLNKCERALLQVLAQRGVATSTQLAILSGYSRSSSGFANALGRLRSDGLAQGGRDAIKITDVGRRAAGPVEPMPSGAALVAHWKSKLQKCGRALLDVLVSARGAGLSKEALAERAGYSVTSSGFANAIGKLRSLELAHGYGDEIRAAEALCTAGKGAAR